MIGGWKFFGKNRLGCLTCCCHVGPADLFKRFEEPGIFMYWMTHFSTARRFLVVSIEKKISKKSQKYLELSSSLYFMAAS